MLTLKLSYVRPAYKNQVNFAYKKPSQFWPPVQKLSQSIPTLQTSYSGPAQKNNSISIPTLKNKSTSIPKLKPSNFGTAHKTEDDFDPRTKKK